MQEDFKEYMKEARQKFCKEINKHSVGDNLVLRTEMDSFLIAYDQAVAKAFSLKDVMSRLPDSDEVRQQAQQMDEKEFDQWWWETVYKAN